MNSAINQLLRQVFSTLLRGEVYRVVRRTKGRSAIALAVFAVVGYLASRGLHVHAALITGIFGLPGQGKTYEAVRQVIKAADGGRQCYSTTPINHPNVMQIEYDDIVDPWLPPGLILCDEVHLVLSYTVWSKLDPKWFEKLSQTRKDGHDLVYTSQHESKVLKQLRDNTNWGWITKSWGPNDLPRPIGFSGRCYEMHLLRRGKPSDTFFHPFRKKIAAYYQTTYAIQAKAAERKAS